MTSLHAGSKDGPNVENWHLERSINSHTSNVLDVAWAPTQPWLASCSVDNSLCVWHTNSFSLVHRLSHQGFVKGLSWDPLGAYLASQSDDNSVCVWCSHTQGCCHVRISLHLGRRFASGLRSCAALRWPQCLQGQDGSAAAGLLEPLRRCCCRL